MSSRLLLLILLVLPSASAGAQAQSAPVRLRPGPAHFLWERPSNLAAERAHEPLGGLLGRGDRDYRYTGFFVGAGLGLALTVLGFAWCNEDNGCNRGRVVPLGLLATGILGLSGAVIGGFIPKASPP
jgi:hypothetical protein